MKSQLRNHSRSRATACGLLGVSTLVLLLSSCAPEGSIATAINQGDLEVVQALIARSPEAIEGRDEFGQTPLHLAAAEGQVDIVKWLIEAGADIEAADVQGFRPLHHSCNQSESRLKLFKLLLEAGADVDSLTKRQGTPLMRLTHTRDCDYESAVYLIEQGASVNVANGAVLRNCTTNGHNDLVEVLFSAGVKLPTDRNGRIQLLHRAALGGVPMVFSKLFVDDLRPQPDSSHALQLLSAAAIGGSARIGAELLDLGVAPGTLSQFSVAPIHKAAESGRVEFVELLLDRGASIDVPNGLGQTAYNIAGEKNFPAVQKLIRERGGSSAPQVFPELKGDYFGQEPPGEQPLHFAPGIVSIPGRRANLTSSPVFSPDGSEMFCTLEFDGPILHSSRLDGVWSPPKPVPFLCEEGDAHPIFTSDGRRVLFLSKRPSSRGDEANARDTWNIWVVERTSDGWGEPRLIPGKLPTYRAFHQFALDADDSILLSVEMEGGAGGRDIYRVPLVDGIYGELESLGPNINTEFNEQMPSLSSNGETLAFTRFGHQGGAGSYDILVARPEPSGGWGEAAGAGSPINSAWGETCPALSRDGKYLWWLVGSGSYWVSTSVLSAEG